MLIAQFTIIGLLGLKKAGIAVPLMVPLIVLTFLFNGYIRQEHFRVAEFLPTNECLATDKARTDGVDMSKFQSSYLQDELRERTIIPSDLPLEVKAILKPATPSARNGSGRSTTGGQRFGLRRGVFRSSRSNGSSSST